MNTQKINNKKNKKYDIHNDNLLNKIIEDQRRKQMNKNPNKLDLEDVKKIGNKNSVVNLNSQDEALNNEKPVDIPKKSKKQAQRLKLDDKLLLFNEKGLKKLYEELMKTDFEHNTETHNLNIYMKIIKSWHFMLFSKYDFSYFLNKITELGQKPPAKVTH